RSASNGPPSAANTARGPLARTPVWPWFTPFRPCPDRSMGRKKGFTGRTRKNLAQLDTRGVFRIGILRRTILLASNVKRVQMLIIPSYDDLDDLVQPGQSAVRDQDPPPDGRFHALERDLDLENRARELLDVSLLHCGVDLRALELLPGLIESSEELGENFPL